MSHNHPAVDMPARHFDLNFNGYWREPNIGGIPAESGVFCVYVCTFNPTEKTVSLKALIYVGDAENANEAVAKHPLWEKWRAQKTDPDQQICFSFAPVSAKDRAQVAAAIVFECLPVTNDAPKTTFPFGETTLLITGRALLIPPNITVSKRV